MQNWLVLRNLKALKGLLDFTGYYRKFVQRYRALAAPLMALLNKKSFLWNDKTQAAFVNLKEAMVNLPIPRLHDFSKPFIVECDTLGKA